MRVALDAMGGDFGAAPNIDGAISALQTLSDLQIQLVGDRPQLEAMLEASGFSSDRLQIVGSDGWVEMH